MSVWVTELRRGAVELCVLAILREHESYGYEILERLNAEAQLPMTESTVYPILSRLVRDGLLAERRVPSPQGPPRRYLRLTALGARRLANMIDHWNALDNSVSGLIRKEIRDDCNR